MSAKMATNGIRNSVTNSLAFLYAKVHESTHS